MPSRKFQSGLARTLANALFQQYAAEDAAKAQESERAFTTSRDMARQLFEEKQDIRGSMEAKNRMLEQERLRSNEAFRGDQRKAREDEKQREFDKWKALLSADTQKSVARTYRPTSNQKNPNIEYYQKELGGLSIAYDNAIAARDVAGAANIAKRYESLAKMANEAGLMVPPRLEEFSMPIETIPENEQEEPGWISENLGKAAGWVGDQFSELFKSMELKPDETESNVSGINPNDVSKMPDGTIVTFGDGTLGIVKGGLAYPYNPASADSARSGIFNKMLGQ